VSYIKADDFQEALIDNFKLVMTAKQIKSAKPKYADKQTPSYVQFCRNACLNPTHEDVKIAWHHLCNRFLRGLI